MVSGGVALLAGTLSCSRGSNRPFERVTLLPFENLSGDAKLDWLSAAAPAILSNQLTGIPKIVILTGGAMRDAYLEGATRVVHGYITSRAGKPHLEASVEDVQTRKTVQHYSNDGGVLPALDGLAHVIDAGAHPFPVSDFEAVETWMKALRGQGSFEDAAAKAPDFGLLYVTWAEALATKNDRAGLTKVLTDALARPALKGDMDRARLALMKADLDGIVGKRAEAFDKVAKLAPNDANAQRGAAELNFLARRYAAAIAEYRAAFALEPENYGLLNQIGYSQALGGDLSGGKQTIEEYSRKPGQEVNGLDSLGEIHFFHGKFAEAEKYFLQSHEKNPAMAAGFELYKAALSRWLAGDGSGADAIHQKYVEFRAQQGGGPPTVGPKDLLQAQWEWTTGRADAAKRRLENRPEYAAQLILWNWDATKLPPPFALLAAKKFDEASPLWKRVNEQTSPSTDSLSRTMYAWCLRETGHTAEAKELLKYYAIPQQADGIFATLVYPRFVELRK